MLDWDSLSGKVAPDKLGGEPPVWDGCGKLVGFDIDGVG